MYSRGSNTYGQQPYGGQSAYNQSLGPNYSGNSAGGPDSASRHLSGLGGSQDAEIGGYRSHTSNTANYGGQYGSVYSSAGLNSSQQVPPMSLKGAGSATLDGRSSYVSGRQESPKYTPADYGSSARGYGHKIDPLYSEKISDYSSLDRRQYGDQKSAYMGRDLRNEPTPRYADSVGYVNQHLVEPHDRVDQASLLRREQLLKVQNLHSVPIDVGARQVDYLTSRGAGLRHPSQDLLSYGGRSDPETRNLQMLSSSSFGSQQTPSILGAAPHRVTDDILYAQGSSNPGYGVSLPPGRDYGIGKGLHGASLDLDYSGSMLSRGSHSRLDELKDDRAKYDRQLDLREEERQRDHLRDRDREREREKDRERERERERLRTLDRREKERERERKLAVEVRREPRDRTPIRLSRDRRGPSLTADARPSRRDSPRHEASHRRHSPVKDKRRDYVCKVHSHSLVDTERDYTSLDKRYPKLFVPPEFSKLVVNWPRENLKLSLYTAVSFEHDFVVEENANLLEPQANRTPGDSNKVKPAKTVWNAKILLMSGLSRSAMEDLVSESDDRLVHISNVLRFCMLKKDRAFAAIGGPWDTVDGADPSVDNSSLVQTALRYAKDVCELDLQKCRHWNQFLEIHYDRIGKDGLFSHKEITVLFIPDLSECVPSFDEWKTQWLEHKRAVAERERQLDSKKEKSKAKEEAKVEKNSSAKKEDKNSESGKKDSKEGKKVDKAGLNEIKKGDKSINKEVKQEGNTLEQGKGDEKNVEGETSSVTAGAVKTVKKKIIKKVVKQKVVDKGASPAENVVADQEDKRKPETGSPNTESPAKPSNVKTVVRKKVIKKVPVSKNSTTEPNDLTAEVKTEKEPAEGSVAKTDDPVAKFEEASAQIEDSVAETGKEPVVKIPGTKTTIKRKVIKKVPKKKVATDVAANGGGADSSKDGVKSEMVNFEDSEKQSPNTDNQTNEGNNLDKKKSPLTEPKASVSVEKLDSPNASKSDITAVKGESSNKGPKEAKNPGKNNHDGKVTVENKSAKEMKNKDGKCESKAPSKEVIEKKKVEEPPRPGFILKTKSSKDSKIRSLSLSLESLLDYTDKDIDETTFEISVFAESIYEMLQYQMGSRILSYLEKLRMKFIAKRNQRKREREETNAKEKEKEKTSSKRLKKDDSKIDDSTEKPSDTEKEESTKDNDAVIDVWDMVASADDETKKMEEDMKMGEDGSDGDAIKHEEDRGEEEPEEEEPEEEEPEEEDPEEEFPEEAPEEDEEMKDASLPNKSTNEDNDEEKNEMVDWPSEKVAEKKNNNESIKGKSDGASKENELNSDVDAGKEKVKSDEKKRDTTQWDVAPKDVVVDKELLQAFRFFDRNRVGYIRVEDMRLIIHTMGKFLSHRDVKELVQSALLESNTGRDDHILYNKLVRMVDI